ncbi:MAG: class I SAM-dependent methyltransferase [Candidatus Dojkabacteria bacterium]|nr:class I SAM-dependent methyltransferase [Candidatus Dojkabacteria bacterium]
METNNNPIPCPICSGNNLELIIKREDIPVHQNLLISNKYHAIQAIKGNLILYLCSSCGFVYNAEFDQSLLSYNKEYDNTQSHSPLFSKHIHNLINTIIEYHNIKNKKIIEIGCGNGQFITELCKHKENKNTGIGFDPSYKGENKENVSFIKEFYDSDSIKHLKTPVDIAICRHVIEHVLNPLELLYNIKKALIISPQSKIFIETPCLEWILQNKVIWDFFYEHCSYFTKESLTMALELSGFQINRIIHIFGGQYLWAEATPYENNQIIKEHQSSNDLNILHNLCKEFSVSEKSLIKELETKIKQLNLKGKIAIWGAGAKGVTFVNLIDKNIKLIDSVVDLNPKKQGKYIYGTGHPIISYHELANRNIKYIIPMNLYYLDEIITLLKESQINTEIV